MENHYNVDLVTCGHLAAEIGDAQEAPRTLSSHSKLTCNRKEGCLPEPLPSEHTQTKHWAEDCEDSWFLEYKHFSTGK